MKAEVGHLPEDGSEIPSPTGTKKTGDVFDKAPSPGSNKLICDPQELPEEGAPEPGDAGAAAGDAEVLAGGPAGDEINTAGEPSLRSSSASSVNGT